VKVSKGSVDIDNDEERQINSIDTDDGKVDLSVTWDALKDLDGKVITEGYLRVTPHDGIVYGETTTSDKFLFGFCSTKGDINKDDFINMTDFSILMYFWKETNPKNTCADINKDGVVNLIDFSIMMYWWTR
jgi:hypothetical protein